MSQCVFTENVLVTIGMFCDDWFQHKFAQFCTNMHNFAQTCNCPSAQVVQMLKHHFTSSIFVSHCGGDDALS